MAVEAIQISPNPVTVPDDYNETFILGRKHRNFSRVGFSTRHQGNWWEARATLYANKIDTQEMFQNGLGRRTVLNGSKAVAFEGFINAMRQTGVGRGTLVKSLDPVGNVAWVRYKDSAGTFAKSASGLYQPSIDLYGRKEFIASGGQLPSASLAESLARQIVLWKAVPKAKAEDLQIVFGRSAPASQPTLELQIHGYIRTLGWRVFNQTASTGTQSADLELADITAAVGTYVAGTEFSANSIGVTKEYDSDRWALDIMMGIAGLGDSYDQRWVLYMKYGRILVYEPAVPPIRLDI